MKPCENMVDLLSALVDDELSPEDRAIVEEHVRTCPACASLLKLYHDISSGLAAECEPPEGFREGVMRRISALPAPAAKSRRPFYRRPWFATAAAAACLAAIVLISPLRELLQPQKAAEDPQLMLAETSSAIAREPARDESAPSQGAGALTMAEAPAGEAAVSQEAPPEAGDAQADDAPALMAPGGQEKEKGPVVGRLQTAIGSGPLGLGAPGFGGIPSPACAPPEEKAAAYFAVITVRGELPELLQSVEFSEGEEGCKTAEVSVETALKLIEAGYETVFGDEESETALVVYDP